MKKLTSFFVIIYKWFISLLKQFILIFTREYDSTVDELQPIPKRRYRPKVMTPSHNNRKSKKGRFVQYIKLEGGGSRAIYHFAK